MQACALLFLLGNCVKLDSRYVEVDSRSRHTPHVAGNNMVGWPNDYSLGYKPNSIQSLCLFLQVSALQPSLARFPEKRLREQTAATLNKLISSISRTRTNSKRSFLLNENIFGKCFCLCKSYDWFEH